MSSKKTLYFILVYLIRNLGNADLKNSKFYIKAIKLYFNLSKIKKELEVKVTMS